MPTSGRTCPRSMVTDCGNPFELFQIVWLVPSLMASMALAAVPLVAVAEIGVYGRSMIGACVGSGARLRLGLHAAPTSPRRLTMLASSRPSRLGGQLSTKFV